MYDTDLDTNTLPKRQNLIYRMLRDETQIFTARLHSRCFGLEFMAGQVEVDLLAAELEGVPFCKKGNRVSDHTRCYFLSKLQSLENILDSPFDSIA